MKRAAIAMLLCCLGCAGARPAPTKPEARQASFEPLPSPSPQGFGGKALTVPSRGLPLVAFRVAFRTGSIDDPPGKDGLTALAAYLMAEGGTQKLTSAQLLEALFPMAAGIGVQVDKELTVFTGQVHRDNVEAFLPLFVDAIVRPRWDPKELERLREDAIQGIERGLRSGNDEELGKAALDDLLWVGHPYRHLVVGSVESLRPIKLEELQAQAARVFTRDRMLVGVGGAVDEKLVKKLEDGLAPLPAKGAPIPALPAPVAAGPKIRIVQKDAGSSAISMGYPYGLRRGDPDFYPMLVAVSALGEHRQFIGRLMKELRVKRGLNYGDYAYAEYFEQYDGTTFPEVNVPRRQQLFSIWLRPVADENALFAIRAALWTTQRYAEGGMTQEELDTVKGFLRGYTLLWEQTPSRRLGYAIDDLFYGTPEYLAGLRKALDSMTLDQVNSAMRRWMRPDRLRIVVVAKDAEGLRQKILSGEPSTMQYSALKVDPSVLADDKEIGGLSLGVSAEQVEIVPVEQLFEKPEAIGGK
jgi:zinc protease